MRRGQSWSLRLESAGALGDKQVSRGGFMDLTIESMSSVFVFGSHHFAQSRTIRRSTFLLGDTLAP